MEVNKELCKMCNKEKLFFLEDRNINMDTHLNRSRLQLNQNGFEKLCKKFLNFLEVSKRVADLSLAFRSPTLKDKHQADTEVVNYITNMGLKSL